MEVFAVSDTRVQQYLNSSINSCRFYYDTNIIVLRVLIETVCSNILLTSIYSGGFYIQQCSTHLFMHNQF